LQQATLVQKYLIAVQKKEGLIFLRLVKTELLETLTKILLHQAVE
jgi:hypothetical protein